MCSSDLIDHLFDGWRPQQATYRREWIGLLRRPSHVSQRLGDRRRFREWHRLCLGESEAVNQTQFHSPDHRSAHERKQSEYERRSQIMSDAHDPKTGERDHPLIPGI